MDGNPALRNNSFNSKLKVKYGIVVYDYLAHNNKELTIHAGEKVEVRVSCYSEAAGIP